MLGLFERSPLIPKIELPEPHRIFDYTNPSHLEIINQRTMRFKQAQTALHALDSNIINGLTIGSSAWLGIYFLPLVTVSIACFCFATHYASHRPEVFKNYQEALNDLIEAYVWSMGRETHQHWHKMGVKLIQDMILTLGPCVTKETIYTWRLEDLNPASGFYPLRPKRDIEPSLEFKAKLAQFASGNSTKEWQFALYGENGSDDFLGALREHFNRWTTNTVVAVIERRP